MRIGEVDFFGAYPTGRRPHARIPGNVRKPDPIWEERAEKSLFKMMLLVTGESRDGITPPPLESPLDTWWNNYYGSGKSSGFIHLT
jgi:hypothetical protein